MPKPFFFPLSSLSSVLFGAHVSALLAVVAATVSDDLAVFVAFAFAIEASLLSIDLTAQTPFNWRIHKVSKADRKLLPKTDDT